MIYLTTVTLAVGLLYGCNREIVETSCPLRCEYTERCEAWKVELADYGLYACVLSGHWATPRGIRSE